jgi:putative membrane protein
VSAAEAVRLREMLLARGPRADAAVPAASAAPATGAPLAAFDASWVRLAPLSLLGLVAVGLVLAGAGQLLRSLGDDVWRSGPVRSAFDWVVHTPLLVTVGGGIVALVVLNAVLSTVLYVLLYGGFVLDRTDDATLALSYGLLTRRSVTIEERRIRGVRIDEPLLLRIGGGAKARIVAAGLGARKDGQGKEKQDSDMLLPTAPVAVVHRVTAAVLRTRTSPATAPLRRHPAAALRVLLVQGVPAALVPSVVLGVLAAFGLVPSWIWLLLLVLPVLATVSAWMEYRNLGHARVEEFLVSRAGAAVRNTVVVRCDGVIAWRFRRTVVQRRSRLLSATAAVAAGKGEPTIRYAAQDDVLRVARDAVPGLLAPFLEEEPAVQT